VTTDSESGQFFCYTGEEKAQEILAFIRGEVDGSFNAEESLTFLIPGVTNNWPTARWYVREAREAQVASTAHMAPYLAGV
jgi:hypothetical protein